jgi:hypothetical protein
MKIFANGPVFFVPSASPESQEEIYAQLASWAKQPVPVAGRRVYSIHYIYTGEQWTSTVGERCTGVRYLTVGRAEVLSDRFLVLAIFPGDPYIIVTDDLPGNPVPSDSANPFMIGESNISSVVLFRS